MEMACALSWGLRSSSATATTYSPLTHSKSGREFLGGGLYARGGPGGDSLSGDAPRTDLRGGDGNDRISAGDAFQYSALDGGDGDDLLLGGPSSDVLDGGGGRDRLLGRGGSDVMSDGDRDRAHGGAGPGADVLRGGSDIDMVDYGRRTARVVVDLADVRPDGAVGERDELVGVENVRGGRGDDRLAGNGRANVLRGRAGDDRLIGRGGDDLFDPGTGGADVSCGDGGSEVVTQVYSRVLLRPDCGEMSFGEDRVQAYPTRATGLSLRYRVYCPYTDDDELTLLYIRCSGTIAFREAAHGRLIARGSFPPGRWSGRKVLAALTPLGRRLVARRGGVTTIASYRVRAHSGEFKGSAENTRWAIRLGSD